MMGGACGCERDGEEGTPGMKLEDPARGRCVRLLCIWRACGASMHQTAKFVLTTIGWVPADPFPYEFLQTLEEL